MKKNATKIRLVWILATSLIVFSCQKTDQETFRDEAEKAGNTRDVEKSTTSGLTAYLFERINESNFLSLGWREQQVNLINEQTTVYSDASDHMEIVCAPDIPGDPRLVRGAVTMNLPTGSDPTLRRIRLRKEGFSGTLLRDITEFKYSNYIVYGAPTVVALQVDIDNDNKRDFNIFFDPIPSVQGHGYPAVQYNTWQQRDAVAGKWEIFGNPLPGVGRRFTLAELTSNQRYANARITDVAPNRNDGEGIRFTIGGGDPVYDNTVSYVDAIIIRLNGQSVATLYDFVCNNAIQQ